MYGSEEAVDHEEGIFQSIGEVLRPQSGSTRANLFARLQGIRLDSFRRARPIGSSLRRVSRPHEALDASVRKVAAEMDQEAATASSCGGEKTVWGSV